MSRRTYVGLIAAALLLGGIPLIAESRAHVGAEQPASGQVASSSNRYSIAIVDNTAILLDAVTGDTWQLQMLRTVGKVHTNWTPIQRATNNADPSRLPTAVLSPPPQTRPVGPAMTNEAPADPSPNPFEF